MASPPIKRYTPEEYLAIERAAEFKSEYISGEMYAMSGSTRKHNLIKGSEGGAAQPSVWRNTQSTTRPLSEGGRPLPAISDPPHFFGCAYAAERGPTAFA